MVVKQFYELIKERKSTLEDISKKWDSFTFNGVKENPSILELESCLKEQVSQTKKHGLEFIKNIKTKFYIVLLLFLSVQWESEFILNFALSNIVVFAWKWRK